MASSTVMYPAPVFSSGGNPDTSDGKPVTSGGKPEAVGDDMTTGVVLPLLMDGEFDVLEIGDEPWLFVLLNVTYLKKIKN